MGYSIGDFVISSRFVDSLRKSNKSVSFSSAQHAYYIIVQAETRDERVDFPLINLPRS